MSTRRPNIVLMVTDDHAAHAIGAYGSVVNATPRIDEIAATGARLDRCYCTNSLCTPSRASILTGTYSHVNGVYTLLTPMDPNQATFVSALRDVGYRTAIVGKWHLGDEPEHRPSGFDYWEILIDQGEYFDPRFVTPDGVATREGYATDLITDLSLDWIDSLDDDEPYCILIHHKAPHRPWEPHPRHADLYTDPIAVPDTFDDDYSTRTLAARHAAMRIADHLTLEDLKQAPPSGLTDDEVALWKYQRYMEDYLRCVAAVDENVGRVTDFLRDRGDLDSTMLMYTSDQGFFLGDHGWFDKRFMYEESLRMPFVVSYPDGGITAGTDVAPMVTNVDIAPTILEAVGVDVPERMQGTSFLDLLTDGEAAPIHDAVYYRYWENDDINHLALAHYGVRTERYKLIYFYNDGLGLPGTSGSTYEPGWELYDLEHDPDEVNNVVADPAYAEILTGLRARLRELQDELGDAPHPSDIAMV